VQQEVIRKKRSEDRFKDEEEGLFAFSLFLFQLLFWSFVELVSYHDDAVADW
jgi:hypothetical protein